MKCISIADDVQLKNTVVTIGKFDGLHKGHEKLLRKISEIADGRKKVVMAFTKAPSSFLADEDKEVKTIVTENEKKFLCEKQGMDIYFQMPMDKKFLALTPDEFIENILKGRLGATAIVCGPDFEFGSHRMGNVSFLMDNAEKYEYELYVVEKEKYHNSDISSSAIRKKICEGKISEANEMLDHPYSIVGSVIEGKKLGRTIGLPTANIIPDKDKLLPPNGVYSTAVVVNGKEFKSISNIGINPTVESGNQIKVETHIIDYENYIYNEIVEVKFYKFIRTEKKFDSVEELKKQIEKDITSLY